MSYVVFLCRKCGEPRYARLGVQNAKCVKCGYVNRLDLPRRHVIVAKGLPLKDAIYLVQQLKLERHGKHRAPGKT